MKSTIRLALVITALTMTIISSLAKTRNMTMRHYNLMVHEIDSSIIGTWERYPGTQELRTIVNCQFNANGTFISFEYNQDKYTVTGRGKWMIKNGSIYIVHGAEKPIPVLYKAVENRLIFGENISYTKLSAAYANK